VKIEKKGRKRGRAMTHTEPEVPLNIRGAVEEGSNDIHEVNNITLAALSTTGEVLDK
jgi:hypothetical protein